MVKKVSLKDFKRELIPISKLSEGIKEKIEFPKYTTLLINNANQTCGGTKPKIVGQMSDLVEECPDKTYDGWKEFYFERHPDGINNATEKIVDMLKNQKEAMELIDEIMVRRWVEDLVLTKTIEGLIIQKAILNHLAEKNGEDFRMATASEEKRNIDGYVGDTPYSIKPASYLSKASTVKETIEVEVVYYKRDGNDIYIYTKRDD